VTFVGRTKNSTQTKANKCARG